MSRPELLAPPEIFYNDDEARKYTSSSRIIDIQTQLTERALELLALPDDGVPRLLLDIAWESASMFTGVELCNLATFACASEFTFGGRGQHVNLKDWNFWNCCTYGSYSCCGSGLSGETLTEQGHQWLGLDISESMLDVALEREVEGDLMLGDMGQGLGLRSGILDGAISISAVQPVYYFQVSRGTSCHRLHNLIITWQTFSGYDFNLVPWLCNADKSCHEPRIRLKAFFSSLYRCLGRGARAVLQIYPENLAQRELILGFAMRAGFSGGIVVDYPHSSKRRKEYLVLTCGPPSLSTTTPEGKGEDGESCSDEDSSEDEENQTVCISDRRRPRKKQKVNKKGKGRDWVLRKKEQMRKKGNAVPADSKYTARKRKDRF